MEQKGKDRGAIGQQVAAPQHDQHKAKISRNHSTGWPLGTLVLSRGLNERVLIGDDVYVWPHEIDRRSGQIKLGFLAPKSVPIYREEIYRRIQHEPQKRSTAMTLWDQVVSHAPDSLEVRTAIRMRDNGGTLAESALYLSLHLLNTLKTKASQAR